MAAPDYAARVAAGAALLDEKRPGWWRRIDIDSLRMEDGRTCILGQEYNEEYWHADAEGDRSALRAAWVSLIEARRASGGAL